MKFRILILLFISLSFTGCVGVSSKGIFGTGVSVALDPRSLGTQIDDSIMQKNFTARLLLYDKKYLLLQILDQKGDPKDLKVIESLDSKRRNHGNFEIKFSQNRNNFMIFSKNPII